MSDTVAPPGRPSAAWLFVLAVFVSAALVFTVEPMMAKLILPILGGSAAVWNTSLAFFQAALLVGYLYAHGLQRLAPLRAQIIAHLAVLALAALVLPLQVSHVLGDPPPDAPALWLVGTLALSVGAPFAALSATAPLLQAWHARAAPGEGEGGPWGLYAASNLGSLLALIAYPVLIEPTIPLRHQTLDWSAGYLAFMAVLVALGGALWRGAPAHAPVADADGVSVSWLDRARWVGLAAIPSSLMLGVTSYLTMDVGSAPFLWVAPLALYLLTFIIAFQARPLIAPKAALLPQSAAVLAACALGGSMPRAFLLGLSVHLIAFFLTALVCHQALVARRPKHGRLTDFYICLSLGGVVGGAFNAFLAPILFTTVVEYPAALVLSCLVRPWNLADLRRTWRWVFLGVCTISLVAAVLVAHPVGRPLILWVISLGQNVQAEIVIILILWAAGLMFRLRDCGPLFALAALILVIAAGRAEDRDDVVSHWRGFFGVLRESRLLVPGLGGEVRMLSHGTTLHGAQAQSPRFRCQPLVYYAHETPIGQVFDAEASAKPRLTVGAVGLGTGSVAAYDRPGDAFTFFEIDPLVVKVSTDPRNFTYVSQCARGAVGYRLGDARLTLSRQRDGLFDVLLIDAFSSDSVPAHLLTVEAMRMYLAKIKPDGVVILHLSNRHLELDGPALAAARAAGGRALLQIHDASPVLPQMWESSENAVIVARTAASLAPFAADPRWRPADPRGVRPWTDDYTNLFGALVRRLEDRQVSLGRSVKPPSPLPHERPSHSAAR
jgi:hypothetical protein